MHKFKSKYNKSSVIRQSNPKSYKDREITNPQMEKFRNQLESFPQFGEFDNEIVNDFVDDLVEIPNVPPDHLDGLLENLSQLTGINLMTIEIVYQSFKLFALKGPSLPKNMRDLTQPDLISTLIGSYFRNVADAALFRGNVDYSRYNSFTFNRHLSNNPLLQDFGPEIPDLDLQSNEGIDNNTSELMQFLGKSSYTFDEADFSINEFGFSDKLEVSDNYEDLVERENENEYDDYRDSMNDDYYDNDDSTGDNMDYEYDPEYDFGH